jgi:hypothetical protein
MQRHTMEHKGSLVPAHFYRCSCVPDLVRFVVGSASNPQPYFRASGYLSIAHSGARVLVLTLGAIIRQVRLSDAYILLVENYSNPLLHFGVFRNLCSLTANHPRCFHNPQ